jgi:photosystem II stability/assembly factor-like uncharacterized protein
MEKRSVIFVSLLVLFFSEISFAQWTKSVKMNGAYVNCMIVSGANIFVGTNRGVFRSTDNGVSWDSVSSGLTNIDIRSLASDGANLFAGTWGDGIFLSTNSGISWAAVSTNLNNFSIHTIAINGSSIFDGTENGICRSTDNGSMWYLVTNGLANGSVQVIAVKGTDILAGTGGGGVFRSTDDGTRWDSASVGLPVGSTIYAFAYEGVNLFAAVFGDGVFLSTNRQMTWDPVNTGLTDKFVNSLVVKGSNVFTGTVTSGVFLSTDNGGTWNTINAGLTDTSILSLCIADNYLFVGTDNGLWQRPISEVISGVENNSNEKPSNFMLEQNYPNPFNPTTTISFHLSAKSFVSLKIYDLLGREVATLVSEELPEGMYSRQWNAGFFASGIYVSRLEAGDFAEIRKIMLLK